MRPESQVRTGLRAGGGSHERTRLWTPPNFPASRENAGNFIGSGLGGASAAVKRGTKSESYGPIPYASEQGIFCGLSGNKSADQGNFRPDQGKGPLARVLGGESRAKRPGRG